MRKRYRQHVNPLKMTALVPREEPVDLPDGPIVEVELGCGDARFLIERAQAHPDRLFVGLDIREEFLRFGADAIARLDLENVSLYTANLIVDLNQLFDDGRIHRFHINFPDPWFKLRQRNRRWLNQQSVSGLVRALEEGGEIFFQSDVWSSSLDALALFQASPALYNASGDWTFLRENPFAERSSRELACLEDGLSIWRLLFVREPDPDGDADEEAEDL